MNVDYFFNFKIMAYFDAVNGKVSFPDLEEGVLKFWNDEEIFKKSIDIRDGAEEFVFYDGPPFATGLPHYGHLLTSVAKDLVPRYKTMAGYKVERRWGWDCHGLPIENLVEKKLGLKSHQDVEDYGVDKFCEDCRDNVLTYAEEWESIINRFGRWVDFGNQYKTMDFEYMETIWWIFKELYEKKFIYEGYKVLPYCFSCHTPLSNFETKQDDSYRDKQDKTVTAKLLLKGKKNEFLLIWTTTPWTLPSNMAVAVGEGIDYVKIKDKSGEIYYMAESRVSAYYKNEEGYELLGKLKGADLRGWEYEPLFDYYLKSSQAEGQAGKDLFKVICADFVNTEDGTGLVHLAPAFGEDDYFACQKENIAFFLTVDDSGEFTEDVPDLKGVNVFDSNDKVIEKLKEKGLLVLVKSYNHSYPHCWRCDTPLIYKAISAWFLNVEPIKEKMLKNNNMMNWVPDHIKDGAMGKWLEGARDWCISRNRYWGSVLPVWDCEGCGHRKVLGSSGELKNLSGKDVIDLHKHFIDEYHFDCEKCGGKMTRVPEVLDCWFESGAMPYAQVHYPFENKEWFETHFPSDFIVEYISQTRGWFYTMIVLSTALFDDMHSRNAVCHGTILAEDGRKMSKRLKNYPDPLDLVNKYGVDSLRFALITSPVMKGDDVRFSEGSVDIALKKLILPLWNAYSFFVTYANIDGYEPKDGGKEKKTGQSADLRVAVENDLDKWILGELNVLITQTTDYLDAYDFPRAGEKLQEFLESLNNWYIRRSRRRFWKSENDNDKDQAYDTLYAVLKTLTTLLAPFIPFTADSIYKNLTKEESVHLVSWPKALFEEDEFVMKKMNLMRDVVNLALSIRSKNKMKVRQPLSSITFVNKTGVELTDEDLAVISDEVNVKEILITEDYSEFAELAVKLDSKKLGPKFKDKVQSLIVASKKGEFELKDGKLHIAGEVLEEGDFEHIFKGRGEADNVEAKDDLIVMLDLELTKDLINEGYLRDLIRVVQDHRKEMDYKVDDKIKLYLEVADEEFKAVIEGHFDYLKNEVLAGEISFEKRGEYRYFDIADFIVGIRSEV